MTDSHVPKNIRAFLEEEFEPNLVEPLKDFVRIPNQSRSFDPEWNTNGLLEKACQHVIDWSKGQGLKDFSVDLYKEDGKTPAVIGVAEMKDAPTILFYGHIDKQPPLTEKWREGLHPYQPVVENGKLYGRGGVDDGYAYFASVLVVKMLQKFGAQKHRFVFFFECDEESDSIDLEYYLDLKKDLIGTPEIMVCLDSGTIDYDHLSLTTNLRGILDFNLKVEVTKEGVHSGSAGGIVPDTFRIARHLLDTFEDSKNGRLIPELNVNIPSDRYGEAVDLIKELGEFDFKIPFVEGAESITSDPLQLYLNNTWLPACTLIGFEGLPPSHRCGNVLNPYTSYQISLRLPPTLSHEDAMQAVKAHFANLKVPHNARITLSRFIGGSGLNLKPFSKKLQDSIFEAGKEFFGKVPLFFGEGGSIPFLNDFQRRFPKAELLVLGINGPESNAHGPNEFLHLDYLKKLISSLVFVFEKN